MRETRLLHKWDKWGPDWSSQPRSRQKHGHSSSKAKGLNEWKSRFCGTHLLLQGHTSCSGLWKCFTRLFAASLMSSCTSTDRISEDKKNNNNQTQLKTQNKEWMLTNQRHRTHGWTENYYREQHVSAWDMRHKQVGQLLCWRMCEGTYCCGPVIPAQSGRSGKERPALEASLSTGQRPPLHRVTPDVRSEPSPSCRRPRLSPAIGHTGTWKQRDAISLSPKNNLTKVKRGWPAQKLWDSWHYWTKLLLI